MIYDDDALQKSIEAGEQRLARLKQAARRRKRWFIGGCVAVGLAIPLGVAAFVASKRVPGAPHFVVTWPKSKTRQSIASGQIVLAREGQPFDVAISEAPKWNVAWTSSGVEQSGESVPWAPQKGGELLLAKCRAKNTDWTAYFSAVVPTRELSLGSAAPDLNDGYRRTVSLQSGSAWVFPHVQALGNVGWDERALPAMSAAAFVVPDAALAQRLEVINETPAPALWQIVSDFDGSVKAPATDGATYASLHTNNLETALPQVGAKLVQLAPDASIKWILRLDKGTPEGIVRLSFDGKRSRQAWIKGKNGGAGTPVTGWENGQPNAAVAPQLPSGTPQATTEIPNGPTPTPSSRQ